MNYCHFSFFAPENQAETLFGLLYREVEKLIIHKVGSTLNVPIGNGIGNGITELPATKKPKRQVRRFKKASETHVGNLIVDYMKTRNGPVRNMDFSELMLVNGKSATSASSVLSRLKREGVVNNPEPGVWTLIHR